MKKIFIILIFLFSFSLVGCSQLRFVDHPSEPIAINDDTPTSITLKGKDNIYKIYVGETLELIATCFPETAVQTVTYTSNDEAIAIVNENGIVTGVSAGKVRITAASTEDETIVGNFYLTVEEKPINATAVEIIGEEELFIDDIIKLNYNTTPVDATTVFTWTSSNEQVATVDENGRVKGLSVGSVVITIEANGISDTHNLIVKSRIGIPTSITISGRNEIEVGDTVKLYISVEPLGSQNTVTWSSSNLDVATVNENGEVIGKASGSTVITAISTLSEQVVAVFNIKVEDNRINYQNLQDNVIDVIAKTKNSILGVSNYIKDSTTGLYLKQSIGSGYVYKAWFTLFDGSVIYDINDLMSFEDVKTYHYYLITNRHVVEGSDRVKIYLHQEDLEVDASLMQYDDKVDVAVVYFEYDSYIKPLPFADSSQTQSGEFAIAIGNPSGYEYSSSATFGIISHPKRYLSEDTDRDGTNDWDAEYIQHDVAINPGNSGGPLINLMGQVVGINTLKFATVDIDNMGFSVPSNVLKTLVSLLEKGEKPVRATLGVSVLEVRDLIEMPDPQYPIPEGVEFGMYIVGVSSTGIAGLAGVQENDILLKFNGVELKNSIVLRGELGKIIVGSNQQIEIELYRNGEIVKLDLFF